jgi:subtilisin family serine protease
MRSRIIAFAAIIAVLAGLTSTAAADRGPADEDQSWIVVLAPGARADRVAQANDVSADRRFDHLMNGFSFRGSSTAAQRLLQNPNVIAVVEDGDVELTDDAGLGIFRIDAHLSQATSNGRHRGAGTRIAVIDSGVDTDHPDLEPNLDLANAVNCDDSSTSIEDQAGHGSHVTGIAAAANNGIGVAGVAAEASILPLKAFDATGFASDSEILCAMDHLASVVASDTVPTVLNMSFVDTGLDSVCDDADVSDVMHEAVCDLHDLGVIMIAGAGNSAIDVNTQIPAQWDEVITVSSLSDFDGAAGGAAGCFFDLSFGSECDDQFTGFSNYGDAVDVIAPGVQIYSTVPGGWDTKSGTSMAAPHVSGVAAIMLSADPTLTKVEIEDLLQSTGECPDGSVNGVSGPCSGAGAWPGDTGDATEPLVNSLRAVQAAVAGAPTSPTPAAGFSWSCTQLACAFTDTSTDTSTDDGQIVSHGWDFGDGTISTDQNPVHAYAASGTYPVSLTVVDDGGTEATATNTVTVSDAAPPNIVPAADAGPDQSVPDTKKKGTERVRLDATGSSDPDGTIVAYSWTDRTGAVLSTASNPNVNLAVGTHEIDLTVTDDDGAQGSDSVIIVVGAPPPPDNSPPTADAGPDQDVVDIDAGGTALVTLDGTGSSDPDGASTIVGYEWTDQGGIILGTTAVAQVELPLGITTVTLTVTDNHGATSSDATTVRVDLPASVWTSHIHDLDVTTNSAGGGRWVVSVDVSVVFTELEALGSVVGADPSTVTIEASSGETLICTTAASIDGTTDGRCSVELTLRKRTGSVTFTVIDVWTPGFTYEPTGSHDDEGDSDGGTITANRP